jgi:hypothetical protein
VVFAKKVEKARLAGTDPHAAEINGVSRKLAGFDASSNPIARFNNHDFLAGSAECACRRQTCHPCPDNNRVDTTGLRRAWSRPRNIWNQTTCCANSQQA